MRTLFLITVLISSGCQLYGPGAGKPVCGISGGGSDCRTCRPATRTMEIVGQSTVGHLGMKPMYSRKLDDLATRHDAKKLACREILLSHPKRCLNHDFKLGYLQAFQDVALGGSGEVPALPPANFWSTCARTAKGHARAQDWFDGYAAGSCTAKGFYEPYNTVASSGGAW